MVVAQRISALASGFYAAVKKSLAILAHSKSITAEGIQEIFAEIRRVSEINEVGNFLRPLRINFERFTSYLHIRKHNRRGIQEIFAEIRRVSEINEVGNFLRPLPEMDLFNRTPW